MKVKSSVTGLFVEKTPPWTYRPPAADAPQVRHWAHTLKGTLLTVGAAPSSALAARIELAAREGRTDGALEQATRLAAEVAILVEYLRPD